MSLADILADAGRRNMELSAAYKAASRRMVSRTLTGLAAAAMEQRRQLGDELSALLEGLKGQAVSIDYPDFPKDPLQGGCSDDPAVVLTWFRDMEARERDLFAALAAQPSLDSDIAAKLAAWAEQARKRASTANHHLDLLALS